jgi:hypothetical protein
MCQRSPPIYWQDCLPGGPCLEGAFMIRKIACTLAILGTLTVSAQAQKSVPKPTKADAVKVVQIISANKTKIATYCKLADLGDEINNASSARDNSKVAQLSKQANDLERHWGRIRSAQRWPPAGKLSVQGRAGVVSRAREARQFLPVEVTRPQPSG